MTILRDLRLDIQHRATLPAVRQKGIELARVFWQELAQRLM